MRRSSVVFMAFMICLSSCLAEEKDPQQLVVLRASYEDKVEKALKPIRDNYLQSLDSLKKQFMTKADLPAALAVDEELQRIRARSQDLKTAITGTVWNWPDPRRPNSTLTFSPKGVLQWSGGQGRWVVEDDRLVATWNGYKHTMTVDWLNGTLSSVREDGASGAGSLLKRERLGGAGRQ